MTKQDLKWLESAGGPFVMLESSQRNKWQGTDNADYEDACRIEDLIGSLEREWGLVLLLGDEALPTAVIELDGQLALLRWGAADGEAELLDFVNKRESWTIVCSESMPFNLGGKELTIFDSAYPGDCAPDSIEFTAPKSNKMAAQYIRGNNAEAVLIEFK